MDAQTSILQTINQTTNSILKTVQAGGGSLPDNVVTTDGEQTLSNKILDDSNTFPATLARVADVAPTFELWNFTSETHQKINFYAVV